MSVVKGRAVVFFRKGREKISTVRHDPLTRAVLRLALRQSFFVEIFFVFFKVSLDKYAKIVYN
jgi:hypothetical protein